MTKSSENARSATLISYNSNINFIEFVKRGDSADNMKKSKKKIMHRRYANNSNKRKRAEGFKVEEDLEKMLSQRCFLIQERDDLIQEIRRYNMLHWNERV